jgi:hypothetical protein
MDTYEAFERAIDFVFNGPTALRRQHGLDFLLGLRRSGVNPHNFDAALAQLCASGKLALDRPGVTPSAGEMWAKLSVPQRQALRQLYLESLNMFEEDFPQDT